jgi:hypothetical protein
MKHPWWRPSSDAILKVKMQFHRVGWATHFVIGNKTHGVMVSAELHTPMPVKAGNGLTLGLRVDDLIGTGHDQPLPLVGIEDHPRVRAFLEEAI